MKPVISTSVLYLVFSILCLEASGQTYNNDWRSVDISGAGLSQDATSSLYSSIGQPIVGLSQGAGSILYSGFLHPSGGPAAIAVEPVAISFGSVIVNTTEMRSVSITNTGGEPLIISSIQVVSIDTVTWHPGIMGPDTIQSGGTMWIPIGFTPKTSQTYTGTLVITSNSPSNPVCNIPLHGVGIATGAIMQLSARALDFGIVDAPTIVRKSIVVSNKGNVTLSIASQSIVMMIDTFPFARRNLPLSKGPLPTYRIDRTCPDIQPGQTDSIVVIFQPPSAGLRTGLLIIASDDANRPIDTIPVTGIGRAPYILVDGPSVINFVSTPNVEVTRQLRLKNIGNAQLTIASLSLGSPFGHRTALPVSWDPGGLRDITISFTPQSVGSYSDTLIIGTNDPLTPALTVNLNGTCVPVQTGPKCTVSRMNIDFGRVLVSGFKDDSIQVINSGTADLVLYDQTREGSNDFKIIGGGASPLIPPGGRSSILVRFSPTSAVSKIGDLVILSNDPGNPQLRVSLSGIGVTSSSERLPQAPEGIVLHQNYPNPFSAGAYGSPSTTIVYEIDRDAEVTLDVYDMYGKLVEQLVGGQQRRGTYRADFDARSRATGIYTAMLTVRADGESTVRVMRMALVK